MAMVQYRTSVLPVTLLLLLQARGTAAAEVEWYHRIDNITCADAPLPTSVGRWSLLSGNIKCPRSVVVERGALVAGRCTQLGYTVAIGTIVEKAGPCGNIKFTTHTRPVALPPSPPTPPPTLRAAADVLKGPVGAKLLPPTGVVEGGNRPLAPDTPLGQVLIAFVCGSLATVACLLRKEQRKGERGRTAAARLRRAAPAVAAVAASAEKSADGGIAGDGIATMRQMSVGAGAQGGEREGAGSPGSGAGAAAAAGAPEAVLGGRLGARLGALGELVASQPRVTELVCLAAVLVCSLGWLRLQVEERPERLYTPQHSAAFADKRFVEGFFGYGLRLVDVIVVPRDRDGGRAALASPAALAQAMALLQQMMAVSTPAPAAGAGTNASTAARVHLRDVCLISAPERGCVVSSPMAFWANDAARLRADDDAVGTMSALDAYDCCGFTLKVAPEEVLGGAVRAAATQRLESVAAFRMSFALRNELGMAGAGGDTGGVVARDARAEAWESALRDWLRDYNANARPSSLLEAHVITQQAFDVAVAATFGHDINLVMAAFVVVTIYATAVLGWPRSRRAVVGGPRRAHPHSHLHSVSDSHAALGPLCVGVVMLGVAASFGLTIACGVPFSPVVSSVIFVLLGLGVDDAFVIMAGLGAQPRAATGNVDAVAKRVGGALAVAGGSITLTSCTDFVAFAVGATTVIPALRAFCLFAAVAVLVDYGLQLTLFMVHVAREERRVEAGRTLRQWYLGCLRANVSSGARRASADEDCDRDPLREAPVATRCDVGPRGDSGGGASGWGARLASWLLSSGGKVCVLLLSAVLLALGGIGCARLRMDFLPEWFVPSGTELKRAITVRDAHFSGMYLPVGVYTKRADYFAQRGCLSALSAALQRDGHVLPGSVDSWFDAYMEHARSRGLDVNVTNTSLTAAVFHGELRAFLATPLGARHAVNVKWSDDNATIVATRVPALFRALHDATDQIAAMEATRAIAASEGRVFDAVAYSYPMVFWEGLAVVQSEVLRNVAIAAVCVFFVCWGVLGNVLAAFIVLATIVMIDVCLLGGIHWIGEYVNMVTAINLLLAVGLCIDTSSHVCHSFMLAEGSRDERARKALQHIGPSVIHGGMTTLLSTCVMLFAQSYVFRVISKMFIMLVVFGLFFGMMLLPILLSLFGPVSDAAGAGRGLAKQHGGKGGGKRSGGEDDDSGNQQHGDTQAGVVALSRLACPAGEIVV
eukprot:g4603.t1